jgi:hypothetical protein
MKENIEQLLQEYKLQVIFALILIVLFIYQRYQIQDIKKEIKTIKDDIKELQSIIENLES